MDESHISSAVILTFSLFLTCTNCTFTVTGQQMLSYKFKENTTFGPKVFSFNSYVSLVEQDFSRKIVLLRPGEFIKKNIEKVWNGKVYGIAVIVPQVEWIPSEKWLETYEYLLS